MATQKIMKGPGVDLIKSVKYKYMKYKYKKYKFKNTNTKNIHTKNTNSKNTNTKNTNTKYNQGPWSWLNWVNYNYKKGHAMKGPGVDWIWPVEEVWSFLAGNRIEGERTNKVGLVRWKQLYVKLFVR